MKRYRPKPRRKMRGSHDATSTLLKTQQHRQQPEHPLNAPWSWIQTTKAVNRTVFIIFIFIAIYVFSLASIYTYEISSESHPNYPLYQHRLSQGWMFGRLVDNSDSQYASFRNKIPILVAVMIGHQMLSLVISACTRTSSSSGYTALTTSGTRSSSLPVALSEYELAIRTIVAFIFSSIFLIVLFGSAVLKILAIWIVNYAIARICRGHVLSPILTWAWCIGILFVNQLMVHQNFGTVIPPLSFLDEFTGMNMRWHVTFNISTLRMISYNMDYYWKCQNESKQRVEVGEISEKVRIETPLNDREYGFLYYLTYLTYAPLYMAGPIITFNNFMSQMKRPPTSITTKSVSLYALRWLAVVLLMEAMLHFFYVVAIKDAKAWKGFSPTQIFAVGFWNLKLIWLKLLIIWRFFRLWAMMDGIETTENMTRCMSNNYSAADFWRGWHKSYNRWLIRYVYIPLGGNKNYILNLLLVFTFVAVWHDIELRLLAWGWLIVLFILPEFVMTKIFCTKWWREKLGPLHLHLCALGAVANILMMMIANLVGFAVGLDGIQEMLDKIWSRAGKLFVQLFHSLFAMFYNLDGVGIEFMMTTVTILFIGAHMMFYDREQNASTKKDKPKTP